jgi:cytochrome P450
VAIRGHCDLRTALAGPLAVAVVASALGLRDVGVDVVLGWYGHIVGAVSAISLGIPVSAEATRAMSSLADHLRTALTARRLRPARCGRHHRGHEIMANAAVMMFGGIETTEGVITNAILHLLLHPEAAQAVRTHPALAGAAVEESLRLEPAAAAVDRYATGDLSLGGSDIVSGDFVGVSITGANRDPAAFPCPDAFDIHRSNPRANLAFAQGPHVCIALDLPGWRLGSRSSPSCRPCPT